MNSPSFRNWQGVQDEVLRRIHTREWKPGDLIPNEADLAIEFGCARTTVNRALRSLADSGLLDRRRKAGTRVAMQPVAKATLDIAVIRSEVEERGYVYNYSLISREMALPPIAISAQMKLGSDTEILHVQALHLADNIPYALEDRWINTDHVADAKIEPFDILSANEWLLKTTPYTHGDIAFSATSANDQEAGVLGCDAKSALFTIDRVTWDNRDAVTKVRLLFRPGYQMRTGL